MTRRTTRAAAEAAKISEAAAVLASKSHEARAEKVETVEQVTEPVVQEAPSKGPKLRPGRNSDREAILKEIRQARGEPVEEEKKEEPKVEEAPKEEPKVEATAEPAVEAAPPVEAKIEPEAPKTVKVKVDGVESEVLASEVEAAGGVAAYQRDKASENRLKAANEANAESKRLMMQIAKQLEDNAKVNAPKQPTDDEFIKSKIDVIRFGTPEESTAALREILQRNAPKAVDSNALVGQAVMAVNRMSAQSEFAKKYPSIMATPLLLKLAQTLEQEELRKAIGSGQPIDFPKLYDSIGVQVSSVAPRGSTSLAQPKDSPTSSSDKEARKTNIVNLPAAAARAELPKEEKPETREESLNRMRKSRGQQPQ